MRHSGNFSSFHFAVVDRYLILVINPPWNGGLSWLLDFTSWLYFIIGVCIVTRFLISLFSICSVWKRKIFLGSYSQSSLWSSLGLLQIFWMSFISVLLMIPTTPIYIDESSTTNTITSLDLFSFTCTVLGPTLVEKTSRDFLKQNKSHLWSLGIVHGLWLEFSCGFWLLK